MVLEGIICWLSYDLMKKIQIYGLNNFLWKITHNQLYKKNLFLMKEEEKDPKMNMITKI